MPKTMAERGTSVQEFNGKKYRVTYRVSPDWSVIYFKIPGKDRKSCSFHYGRFDNFDAAVIRHMRMIVPEIITDGKFMYRGWE